MDWVAGYAGPMNIGPELAKCAKSLRDGMESIMRVGADSAY